MNIKTELNSIIKAIFEHTQPDSIYLFGSYAYGQPTENSDIDIYIVIPDGNIDIIELGAEIRYALYKILPIQLDLLIGKKSVFERRSKELTLESIIAKQGTLLYGK
jgi:predicted nucleotidyltransferase